LLVSFLIIHAVIGSGGTSKPHHSSYIVPAGISGRGGLENLGIVMVGSSANQRTVE
jgi:hypothetical protein